MVRKAIAALLAGVLALGVSAAGCEDTKRRCKNGTVRHDVARPGRYWVCEKGREVPYDAPERPVPAPKKA